MIIRDFLYCFLALASLTVDKRAYSLDLKEEIEDTKANGYANIWAVQLDQDDEVLADEIARSFGFKHDGRIGSLSSHFRFVPTDIKRMKRNAEERTSDLNDHPRVLWAERQKILLREKRDSFYTGETLERMERELEERRKRLIVDPEWPKQWYLYNWGQYNRELKGSDINVVPVWERGYTGKDVVVSILDDGLDHTHPDLKRNYDPKASTDLNGNDDDPFPNDKDPYNAHGTKCGGEVGAEANNEVCGAGVAPDVNLGGVRMLDGLATDQLEASALSFNPNYVDIYSNCWGPKDDGRTFGRPGKLGMTALEQGAKKGRKGKGSIYVWATGNGGLVGDDCNADGYTSSIYTISIGAISAYGLSTYYDEKCASTMAVTFTGDSHKGNEKEIVLITTDLKHKCTNTFRGTSSAAPLASGMFALVLQANPNLTWRDLQHLVVKTAKITSPKDYGWQKNAAGNLFNHKFGFGRLDTLALVNAALNWSSVPEQHICKVEPSRGGQNVIPLNGELILKVNTDACEGTKNFVRKLEHVQATLSFTLSGAHRGELSIDIQSAQGTVSNLLNTRHNDHDQKGLDEWAFMTVHLWGENPAGEWQLRIKHNQNLERRRTDSSVDIEDEERLLIDKHKMKARRDEILKDYDSYHDEIHHGRFGNDYMRDEVTEEDETEAEAEYEAEELKQILSSSEAVDQESTGIAGQVTSWYLTLYGTQQ